MIDYPMVRASKMSLFRRKPVFGMGTNDAWYKTEVKINGNRVVCPYYSRWKGLLERCYCPKLHAKRPTYIGCSVVDEWLSFTKFREWMVDQDWLDKHLDKDLLIQGNKTYSPEACIFVNHRVNTLLLNSLATRGKYKLGVNWQKQCQKFTATVTVDKKRKGLGLFDSESEAHEAYKIAKYAIIKEVAIEQAEPLKTALLNYVIK